MSGADALQGYRYQFLCSLEYAFAEIMRPCSRLTRLWVESPLSVVAPQHQDIVDFALDGVDGRLITAQVKSTRVSRSITGLEVLRLLARLVKSDDSEQYLIVTSQHPSRSAIDVGDLLSGTVEDGQLLADQLRAAAGPNAQREGAIEFTAIGMARLTRSSIHFDSRSVYEVSAAVRDRVRSMRRESGLRTGAGSAGLLTNHLVGIVLEKASQPAGAYFTSGELKNYASIGAETLSQSWGMRDWGRLSGFPPKIGDIERPELIDQIKSSLGQNSDSSTTPKCCVLTGPSGIGKSTLAISYAADFADLYDEVFWVHCSSSDVARLGYETIAQSLRIPFGQTQTDTQLRNLVHRYLSTISGSWLLVLDNAESRKVAEFWIPTHGSGGILVTTTDRVGWNGADISTLNIPVMTRDQAVALVKARFTDGPGTTRAAEEMAHKIADELSYWPLALELASNYMRSCSLQIEDTDNFLADLKNRALADDGSIPIGYPNSLVVAIKLVLERLEQRSYEDEFARLALIVLRYATYTVGRQVPLDLLIQCATLTIKEAIVSNIYGPVKWQSKNYPTWEILRAVERDCLVVRGRDIDLGLAEHLSTIGVNEIVREVVRTWIGKEDPTGALEACLIETVAFFTQSWIVWFTEKDALDQARPLMTHAHHVADLGLTLPDESYGLALLWGNLANVLLLREQFEPAEKYLRAELGFLLRESDNREIILVQTLVSLARLLVEQNALHDSPQQEVIPLLERAASLIGSIDPDKLMYLRSDLISASHLTGLLSRHSQRNSRVEPLREVFDAYNRMLSLDDAEPATRAQRLEELLRTTDFVGAESLARTWLSEIGPSSIAFPICLRYLVESLAFQEKWNDLSEPVEKLKDAVRAQRVRYVDASTAVLNSGMCAALGFFASSPGSAAALRNIIYLADECETLYRVFNGSDSGCLYALRAADGLACGHMSSFSKFLEKVDFGDLRLTDPLRYRGWSILVEFMNEFAEDAVDAELDEREPATRHEPEDEGMSRPPTLDRDSRYMSADDPSERNLESGEVEIGESMDDGTRVLWTLYKKGEGVRNGLVVGPPRTGKTSLLWALLEEVVKSGKLFPILIDYAERRGFTSLSGRYVVSNIEDAEALLDETVKIVQDRDVDKGVEDFTVELHGIIILIDGAARLFAQSDRALRAAEFIADNGPRNSVGIIFTVEDTGLDHLGGSLKLRDSLAGANKVAFAGPGQQA